MPAIKYREPIRAISGSTVYPGAWLTVLDEDEAPAELFADPERATRLPNPIRADAAGYFPPLYVDTDVTCRCVLTDVHGVEVFDLPALGEHSLLSVSDDDPRGAAGAALPLATRTFYAAKTTELTTVYQDDGFQTPLSNPVVADDAGAFPDVYLRDGNYRVQLHAAPGNPTQPPALGHNATKPHIGGPLIYDIEMGAQRFYPLRYGVLGVVRTVFTPAGGETGDAQTWTRPEGVNKVLVLLVGGGGDARVAGTNAALRIGGGGGGGQVRVVHEVDVTGDVTVRVPDTHLGLDQNIPTVFGDLVAARGGGWHYEDGLEDGASGGGGAVSSTLDQFGVLVSPGVSNISPAQGNGGAAWCQLGQAGTGAQGLGGGGGGAGGPGSNAIPIGEPGSRGGDGGPGVYVGDIVGDDIGDEGWFGGGGGGGHGGEGPPGSGGKGGGASGRAGSGTATVHGTSGTGGGGGGHKGATPIHGRGGGGIVVVLHYDPAVHGPGYWPY